MHPTEIKLRAARVPVSTFQNTLKLAGQTKLSDQIRAKDYDDAGNLRNYAIYGVDAAKKTISKVLMVLDLFAKELCIAGPPLFYTPVSPLLSDLQLISKMGEPFWTPEEVLRRRGPSYLVVSNLFEYLPETPNAETRERWLDLGTHLEMHIDSGGGLILGNKEPNPEHFKLLGCKFEDQYHARFEKIIIR